MREKLIIVGDFNIHVDSSNNESKGFLAILNANGLTQHVTSPTHQKGHVFISGVSDANSSSSLAHYAVLCYLNVNRPKTVHKSVKFRAFRKIPVPAYQNDVKVVLNNQSKTPDNINDLIGYYNSTLQNLTDKYAPLQCEKIALRPHSPWYMSALRRKKRARRRGERVAAQTQLEVGRQIVQNMYRRRNEQLVETKSTYFTNKESKDDPKALFRLTRNMMGNSGDKILPVHTCKKTGKRFQRLFHQQNIEHKEQTRIDRYTYRRFGDKLFFWSSIKYLYGCY